MNYILLCCLLRGAHNITVSVSIKRRFVLHRLCSVILENMATRTLMEEVSVICLMYMDFIFSLVITTLRKLDFWDNFTYFFHKLVGVGGHLPQFLWAATALLKDSQIFT